MNDFNLLSNRFQDRYLYEINRNTFNKIGSNAFFQNHFGESLVQVDSLNIIVGTDSGLLLRYLTNLDLPEGSRYLFIEPPEILELIKEFTADLDLGDQITLSSSDDWTQSLSSYNFNDYVFIERVRVIESLGATDGYLSEYRHILFNVNQKISELIWQTRASIGGRDFAEQHIDNLVEQINPAIQLKRLFTGYTAVLLAGGPSLDEAIPWVRAHQDKLLIIAVSRISRRLIETGIEPHIVVSVDPQPVSFQVSKEMLLFDPEKTVFVHANHVSFSLLAQWPGQSAYLGDTFPWKTPLNTANIGIVPPTVSNTALNLAIEMGCSRVILAGVDLCHSKEGYCHAQGSDEHSSGPQLSGVRLQVTTNGGRMAETTPDFYSAISCLEFQLDQTKEFDCEVINPFPGAAKVANVNHVELSHIELSELKEIPLDRLSRHLPKVDSDTRIKHYESLLHELARVNGRLRSIRKLAKEALQCNDGLFGRNNIKADFKYKKRMDKIERRLNHEFKDISPLVLRFGGPEFLRMPPSDREWTDEELEMAGQTYYTAYLNSADNLLNRIETAQKRIESAINETSSTPDFPQLIDQWTKDEIPGRGIAWLARYDRTIGDVPAKHQKTFETLNTQFNAQQEDRPYLLSCEYENTLSGVRSKIYDVFKHGDPEELERLINNLQNSKKNDASELCNLALGYLAELNNQPEKALQYYSFLVDSSLDTINEKSDTINAYNSNLEDALRRMAYITIASKDYNTALMILDSLAAISPVHEPQYAELLRLTGNTSAALDVYANYLKKVPDDLVTVLKLGQLYQTLGVKDSARWAYQYVAKKDPKNRAAPKLLAELNRTTA